MYEKYNSVLRFYAAKNEDGSVRTEYSDTDAVPFLQKKCGELGLGEWTPTASNGVHWQWHNKYATTIHAINSVVVKMSRLTKVAPLYRGWTGATLPAKTVGLSELMVTMCWLVIKEASLLVGQACTLALPPPPSCIEDSRRAAPLCVRQ